MTKKYKLSDECENGLYHVIALRDIPRYCVRAGNKGGFASGEHNLSHEGDCWIGDGATVCNDAFVHDNAYVRSYDRCQTVIYGDVVIGGTTRLSSGIWEITPKVIHGSRHDVIYNTKQIAIGCECHSLEWWEKHGLKLAKKDYFTPEQIEEYRGHLDAIKKEYADE